MFTIGITLSLGTKINLDPFLLALQALDSRLMHVEDLVLI